MMKLGLSVRNPPFGVSVLLKMLKVATTKDPTIFATLQIKPQLNYQHLMTSEEKDAFSHFLELAGEVPHKS